MQCWAKLNKKWVIIPLLVLAVLTVTAAATLPDDKLHVCFLDVGQGDAILLHRGKLQVLVDGGPSPQAITNELGKRMPFWDRTIEMVVLTHPDIDHLAGLIEVLRRYRVDHVLYADFPSSSTLYENWVELLEEQDARTTIAQAGQQIALGSGELIEILSPPVPPLFEAGSDDNGIVTRLSYGKASFLLTGDISKEVEYALIADRADLTSTVLKVAHHGSADSTTTEFLNVVNPKVAGISVGEDNSYGHPRPETLERLAEKIGEANVYRTDKDGTIEFITDGERLWVKTDKSSN